jgi:hypothetical protein
VASDAAAGGTGFNATTGVATITPQTALPVITNPVVINGYTQAGAQLNNLTEGDNAVLKVQLNLSAVPAGNTPLTVAANNSTIQGLVVNGVTGDSAAIGVGGTGDQIEGNFIGTDGTGTQVVGNASWGIALSGSNALVGGTTPAARNIISGNGNSPSVFYEDLGGILDSGTGDSIQGNYIGTDVTGTKALGNGRVDFGGTGSAGVDLNGNNNNLGGTALGAANLISGNLVGVFDAGTNSIVEGNLIGTDVTGTSAVGNGTGVELEGGLVGGTTPAARNIISGNGLGIFDAAGPGGADIRELHRHQHHWHRGVGEFD